MAFLECRWYVLTDIIMYWMDIGYDICGTGPNPLSKGEGADCPPPLSEGFKDCTIHLCPFHFQAGPRLSMSK